MRSCIAILFVAAIAVLAADARAVAIAWSAVGNAGNANDPADGDLGTPGIQNFGAVPYAYKIGTYDVTAGQYVEFLNAKDASGANTLGLYNRGMDNFDTFGGVSFNNGNPNGSKYSVVSGKGNHPVNSISWYDAIRFANWLNNGQGSGDTETGAYTLLGGTPTPSNGLSITRNAGATIFLPSENEWYKAAYNIPGTNSYFQCPTSSNTIPTASSPTALPNHANFSPGGPNNLTDVGAYSGTTSPYGAFDMGGNVVQWNEALISGSFRGLRGGSFDGGGANLLSSGRIDFASPTITDSLVGFRVANIPGGFVAPEPSTLVLAAFGFMGLAAWGWRRRLVCKRFHSVFVALIALLVLATDAQAVVMNWSAVGNPGNAADGNGFGSVPYAYRIGTYDVTNAQYAEFLNIKDQTGANALGLWNPQLANTTFGGINFIAGNANGNKYTLVSGAQNHPVNAVSWYDTLRFVNWLNNGQGNGDTETGSYTLGPLSSTPGIPITPPLTHNAGSQIWLPTENEWYKAAYYNPGTSSYFQYPTSSNAIPTSSGASALANHANFFPNGPSNLTNVGAYTGTTSPYGAFDMGGNVFQWNEVLISGSFGSFRGNRGGSFALSSTALLSATRISDDPSVATPVIGFRVAANVPEPSTLALAAFGFTALASWGWRRRKR